MLHGRSIAAPPRRACQGERAYEAWSEAQTADGWTTMFKLVLNRVD